MSIIFENDQWQFDEQYVTAPNRPSGGEYWFDVSRLLEPTTRDGVDYYDWPLHLAEKTWVDIELFIECFLEALKHFKLEHDEEILNRTIMLARETAS